MIIIFPLAFILAIGILIGELDGFKRGEKALPRKIMKVIYEKYKKTAQEGIDKKALSQSIMKAVDEENKKIAQEILDEYRE